MNAQQTAVKLLLGVLVISAATFVAAVVEPNSSCNRACGSLDIPYPFGTSEGCYLDSSFLITCDSSSFETSTPTPFLGIGNIKVLNISLDGELRVSSPIARYCPYYRLDGLFLNTFPISYTKNVLTTVGCETLGFIKNLVSDKNYTTGCISVCDSIDGMVNGSCSGIGCCQTSIPVGIKDLTVSIRKVVSNHSNASELISPCGFAFVVEEKAYNFSSLDLQNMQDKEVVPLVLDWAVGNQTCEDAKKNTIGYACKANNSECYNSTNGPGYRCNCSSGYYGNPYLSGGCQDIDECETPNHGCTVNACVNHVGSYRCSCPKGYEGDGRRDGNGCSPKRSNYRNIVIALGIGMSLLVLLLGGCLVLLVLKRRKPLKLEEQYFQQNSGSVDMTTR
ncbi:hypothetical protein I3842_15G125800 [Carya illinoinensis]|uniref:EGF-like domain-containing protein n=1 Tax=Carya illinoinensis TaxID=32201 RepID=A0A922D7Q6_CARIL|nr:hypothetical protein I3842_15G125800 [Carya illinoinensis]